MAKYKVFYNGKVYPQAGDGRAVDSLVVQGKNIVAVGRRLEADPDFKNADRINLKGHTVLPGFTDAHTHFYFLAKSLDNVKLDGSRSVEEVLEKIRVHASKLPRTDWIIGEGFSPDRWRRYVMPDRIMLDEITGGRPAAIFSKDQHMLWVNSRALKLAGLSARTTDPAGGRIERDESGNPSGILRELPGFFPVIKVMERPRGRQMDRLYNRALEQVYRQGVTGVHSFDGPDAFEYFTDRAEKGRRKALCRDGFDPTVPAPTSQGGWKA